VPNVAVIIGEGGSGGAVAIATANRVLMLEHAIYSVISPEGAASILWRDSTKAQDAAVALKITAAICNSFGHYRRDHPRTGRGRASRPRSHDRRHRRRGRRGVRRAQGLDRDALRRQRRDKFLAIGPAARSP
jgi:acetyl-CoA carboxylase carboxyl transferase subunit alpha